MKQTVVLLLSDKRSGSTILQDELCKHPGVRHVEYSPHTYFETHYWLMAARILGMPLQAYYGHRVYGGHGSRSAARAALLDCVRTNVPSFEAPASDLQLVTRGWDALCDQFARPVFFEKSPQHLPQWAALSLLLDWINTTEHRVKVLGLVRNPHAVLHSAERLFGTSPRVRQHGWADMYRNLLAFQAMLPSGVHHVVRYEELIADPRATLGEVQEFIGLSPAAPLGDEVHRRSTNKWRDDPSYHLQLHGAVAQVASHFGYSASDLDNSGKVPPGLAKRVSGALSAYAHTVRNRVLLKLRRRPVSGTTRRAPRPD